MPMNGKPNVFVGLDDDTLVIGYHEMSPLQVWDLVAGKVVRLFDGKGQWSRSMINLPRGRIATGWFTGVQSVVAIFDAKTGKQLQELIALGITSTGWRWSKITFSPCAKTRPFVFGARTLRDRCAFVVLGRVGSGEESPVLSTPSRGCDAWMHVRLCVPYLSLVALEIPFYGGLSPLLNWPLLHSSLRKPRS